MMVLNQGWKKMGTNPTEQDIKREDKELQINQDEYWGTKDVEVWL